MAKVMSDEATAELIETFRKALMVEHHDDWDMETISEAAHICARAIGLEHVAWYDDQYEPDDAELEDQLALLDALPPYGMWEPLYRLTTDHIGSSDDPPDSTTQGQL